MNKHDPARPGYDDRAILRSRYLTDRRFVDLSWDITVADARLKAMGNG